MLIYQTFKDILYENESSVYVLKKRGTVRTVFRYFVHRPKGTASVPLNLKPAIHSDIINPSRDLEAV